MGMKRKKHTGRMSRRRRRRKEENRTRWLKSMPLRGTGMNSVDVPPAAICC